ncbi:MAG: type II secretion system protein GspH [Pseudorhodobacter sp. PARRP1]|nr:MAG: type II secretion system protein GspH [Pseudorhodobacter sp. PARRP1]
MSLHSQALPDRNGEAGMTLIEMLVVLAVIGVATGATMLGLNAADRGARAQSEAVRLASNLSLGIDEAIVSGAPLALLWDQSGYRFVAWSEAKQSWEATLPAQLSARHDLSDTLQLALEGTEARDAVLIAPSAVGAQISFIVSAKNYGQEERWIVDFDGFSATAHVVAPS